MLKHIVETLWILSRQPHCVIRIKHGQARTSGSKVPAAFVQACAELATQAELGSGCILGLKRQHGIQLEFSETLKPQAQRLRNLWQIYR